METETVMYEARPPHVVDCAGDEGSSSEDEIREAAEELVGLKTDKVYHDFVVDVVLDRKIVDDESADPDFVAGPEAEPIMNGQIDLKDLEDDDSSSSSDESVYEEAVEDVEVKVPPASLKEAAARYPPFWRVNDKLRREANDGYKSDEDADFKLPEKCGRCSKAEGEAENDPEGGKPDCEECHNQGLIDSDDTESTTSSKAEAEDDDLDNLVEMVEDLALPSNDVEIPDAGEGEPERQILASIVEFDDADYKSDEDPDYVAPIDIDNVLDVSSSSADDESSDQEEEMQE